MLTSIIIPAHNEQDYIRATLESYAYSRKRNESPFETIVVANGCDSSDDTAQIAKDLGARVIELEEGNVSKARNVGASVAEGEILIFNDADTIVSPTYVKKVSELICNDLGDYGSARVKADSWKPSALLYALMINFGTIVPKEVCGNMFVKREYFDQVNGFNEEYTRGEDTDFGTRLKANGARINFLLSTYVIPSSRSASMKRILEDTINYLKYKSTGKLEK